MSRKGNMPQIKIQYLVDIELTITKTNNVYQTTLNHELGKLDTCCSDTFQLGNKNTDKYGKKGFFLSGGSVDANGKESGCLMNGEYTFFDSEEKYPGILGNVLSDENGEFATEQSITISTINAGDKIKYIVIYFDSVAGEYATSIKFSNEPNVINKNTRSVYIKGFESDNLSSVKITFLTWSKANSLAKVLKIKTGITGVYDYDTIKKLDFSNDKISNEEEVSFGVTSQFCEVSLIDKSGDIQALHEANLLLSNTDNEIKALEIFLTSPKEISYGNEDGETITETIDYPIKIGEFILDTYKNKKGTNIWEYSLIDRLQVMSEYLIQPMEITSNATLYSIIMYVLSSLGLDGITEWSQDALTYCQSPDAVIPNAYIEVNQYAYDVLCKCCEVGLLRVFINPEGKVRIERGL